MPSKRGQSRFEAEGLFAITESLLGVPQGGKGHGPVVVTAGCLWGSSDAHAIGNSGVQITALAISARTLVEVWPKALRHEPDGQRGFASRSVDVALSQKGPGQGIVFPGYFPQG